MKPYREKIMMTYKFLWDTHEELQTRTINLGMTGVMEAVNSVFIAGDSYRFDMDQFRGTTDANLNLLLEFFDNLETLMNSMANLNGITEEELEEMEQD
jgi:hypothetical protein